MKLLALDTAMAACSVAVIDTEHELPLAYMFVAMERGHAEALAPMTRAVMAEAGLNFADLNRIAVTTGPGTFTGVRIGLAMARGLGLALNIPVVGLDTLSAIAANVTAEDSPILVVADARKDEVYGALFAADHRVSRAPAIIPVAQGAEDVPEGSIILGTGADAVMARSGRSDLVRSRAGDLPVAANFARATALLPVPLAMPAPLYLRAADAKPQAGLKRRLPQISFREATAAEAGIFAALHAECFDNPWNEADFAALMAAPGAAAGLALDAGEPVGFALLRRAADEAEIISIGTRPFAQRRGIARGLIAAETGVLARLGVTKLFLEVAASNISARALYAACGFSEAGTRRDYYGRAHGGREDAIVMRKEIGR